MTMRVLTALPYAAKAKAKARCVFTSLGFILYTGSHLHGLSGLLCRGSSYWNTR